jgi:undecaprenyl diphosphate synthase
MSDCESTIPRHIAIIMDGNGRWAKAHGYARNKGHREGVKATRKVVEAAADKGIQALTLFAFSSENWNRPREEVNGLMSLFLEVIKREVDALHKNGICIRFIGDRNSLAPRLQKSLVAAEQKTRDNTGMKLVLAMAYGGHWDIVQAAKSIATDVRDGKLDVDAIDQELFGDRMSLAGLEPPDLLIRTGGEHRVSNFLLWDMAYSELYFTPSLWPEFGEQQFEQALDFFAGRQRRFGKTGEQVSPGLAKV